MGPFHPTGLFDDDWHDWCTQLKPAQSGLLPANRQVLCVTGKWYTSQLRPLFGNVAGDCWQLLWDDSDTEYGAQGECDNGPISEDHAFHQLEVVQKKGYGEHCKIKAKRNKPDRRKTSARPWVNTSKSGLGSDVHAELKEYFSTLSST